MIFMVLFDSIEMEKLRIKCWILVTPDYFFISKMRFHLKQMSFKFTRNFSEFEFIALLNRLMLPKYDRFFFILLPTELPIYSFWYSYIGCQDHTSIKNHLDGHVCIKFGFVCPWLTTPWSYCPEQGG